MGEFAKKITFEPLRSIAFGSIAGTYTAVGTGTIAPSRKIKVVNLSNANVFFSDDGVHDMDIVPSNGFILWDFTDSSSDNQQRPNIPIGTLFYIRYASAPSSGAVYITVVYAS